MSVSVNDEVRIFIVIEGVKKGLGYLDFCKTLRIIPFEPFEKYLGFETTKGVRRESNPQRISGSSQ